MKKIIIIVIVVLILIAGIHFFIKDSARQNLVIPSLVLTNVPTSGNLFPYCSHQDIQTMLTLSHGAGNVFGTFTLKNISNKTCDIDGNKFITAEYDKQTTKNITVTHVGNIEAKTFHLSSNQTIYSQVHYPNGPQCGLGITTTKVTFHYAISPTDTVIFSDEKGITEQSVTTCTSASEITTIELWNISSQPITP